MQATEQNINAPKNFASSSYLFVLLHFLISSIGLFKLAYLIAVAISQSFILPLNAFISYRDWASLNVETTKPAELVHYALSVSVLVIYYFVVAISFKGLSSYIEGILKRYAFNYVEYLGYFGCLLLLNVGMLLIKGELTGIFAVLWFLALLIPIFPLINLYQQKRSNERLSFLVILLVLMGSLTFMFYPYISGKFSLSNDYMDVPEQTKLSTGLVDNTTYINKHNIGGLHKYDPRVDKGNPSPSDSNKYIKLHQSVEINTFIKGNPQKFEYDNKLPGLVVHGQMSFDDFSTLLGFIDDKAERQSISTFYLNQQARLKSRKEYSNEEIEFIKKNRREFENQAVSGHYFHHQNTMLGTINEYILGKPQANTVFLYGWLSTIVIAETMKAIGGINFDAYLKAFYSFYPLYYLLVILAAALIFRKKGYIAFVGAMSIGTLFMLGFESIRFAPGFNPIRHLFDIFTLVSFYWYLFAPRRNLFFYALALAFSIVGILFSKEFGLVLLLSMAITTITKSILDRKKPFPEIAMLTIAVIAAVASLLLIKTGKNPTLIYVLMGVATPPADQLTRYGLMILFSVVYIFLIAKRKSNNNWGYITLFWFLYVQSLLIYYVWNPAPNHIQSLGGVLGIMFALFIKHIASNYNIAQKYENNVLLISNALIALFIFLPGALFYYMDWRDYQSIFINHTVYKWDFPRAGFQTTMDPSVFENAVGLIDKYSSGNSIFIISKYDNILPFLSEKYSAMPFDDMPLSLVTDKEMKESIDTILHDRPKYLFVDTDINRSHLGDIYDKFDPVNYYARGINGTSGGRAMVLDNLSKVFDKIQGYYKPIEIGNLITVYQRQAQ